MDQIVTGNATEANATRGWFVGGDYLPESAGIRKNDTVEIKWGVHAAGEHKPMTPASDDISVSVLISGAMDVHFPDRTVSLTETGDYVMWGPLEHGSVMLKDSVVATVRWAATPETPRQVVAGNGAEAVATRGWFVGGNYLPESAGIRKNDTVEIKWGIHPKGQERQAYAEANGKRTVCMILSGAFELTFDGGRQVTLAKQAEYVMWGPTVGHTWRVLEDSLALTARW